MNAMPKKKAAPGTDADAPLPPAPANLPAVSNMPFAGDIATNPAMFNHLWRVAQLYSASALVPKHMQGKPENCMVALDMARLLDENPLVVMQNIYFVNDRAGWYTQYLIARVNKSGLIKGRITWTTEGEGKQLSVTARAVLADSDEAVLSTCSMAMADAEGWTKNAKYKSMAEHMLKWRSAAFLIRLNFPEVMLGMPTSDELEDMRFAGNLEPQGDGTYAAAPPRPQRSDYEARKREAMGGDSPATVDGTPTTEDTAESADNAALTEWPLVNHLGEVAATYSSPIDFADNFAMELSNLAHTYKSPPEVLRTFRDNNIGMIEALRGPGGDREASDKVIMALNALKDAGKL